MRSYEINEAVFDVPDDWRCEAMHLLERDADEDVALMVHCVPCCSDHDGHLLEEHQAPAWRPFPQVRVEKGYYVELCGVRAYDLQASYRLAGVGHYRRQLTCTLDGVRLTIATTGLGSAAEVCDRLFNAVVRTVRLSTMRAVATTQVR